MGPEYKDLSASNFQRSWISGPMSFKLSKGPEYQDLSASNFQRALNIRTYQLQTFKGSWISGPISVKLSKGPEYQALSASNFQRALNIFYILFYILFSISKPTYRQCLSGWSQKRPIFIYLNIRTYQRQTFKGPWISGPISVKLSKGPEYQDLWASNFQRALNIRTYQLQTFKGPWISGPISFNSLIQGRNLYNTIHIYLTLIFLAAISDPVPHHPPRRSYQTECPYR